MKKHYDFSNAERGTMHRPAASLKLPVFLESDVSRKLKSNAARKKRDVSSLVNAILRAHLETAELLK